MYTCTYKYLHNIQSHIFVYRIQKKKKKQIMLHASLNMFLPQKLRTDVYNK